MGFSSREFSLGRIIWEQSSIVAIVQGFFSKAVFLGSNYIGVDNFPRGKLSGAGTSFLGCNFLREQSSRDNHSRDWSEGELSVGAIFLGDNFPEDNHPGANCLRTTSPRGNCPETMINIVGQKVFL